MKKDMIKSIILDAGGVLFTTNWNLIKEDILKKYGFSIFLYSDYPQEIQKKYKGLNLGKVSFKNVIKDLSKRDNIDKILIDYEIAYKKHQKLNEGLLSLLKKLKNNYNLFCLTNTNDLHFELNKKNNLFDNFKKSYSSYNLGLKKPDEKAFLHVLKDNNLSAEETLFIDNNQKNIDAAKKLGMKAILFENNSQLIKDLKELEGKI